MNDEDRAFARILFELHVHRSSGQAYEDVFTAIMGYASPDFIPVKPQGASGDRKNDGYNRQTGHYYQVYAPENPASGSSHSTAVSKLATDFAGLKSYWHASQPIKRFSFVFNDKYHGSFPTIETDLLTLKTEHALDHCGIFLAKHLEDTLFTLPGDIIRKVVNFFGDPTRIQNLDYSILSQVIAAILAASKTITPESVLHAPDFEQKLTFNGLGAGPSTLLKNASYQRSEIDHYFARNSTFVKQELRDSLNRIYLDVRSQNPTADEKLSSGDLIFFELLKRVTPSNKRAVQDAALVVMAYFFESCDIFDDPSSTETSNAAT